MTSSLHPTKRSAHPLSGRYTERTVSRVEPAVENTKSPAKGAVQPKDKSSAPVNSLHSGTTSMSAPMTLAPVTNCPTSEGKTWSTEHSIRREVVGVDEGDVVGVVDLLVDPVVDGVVDCDVLCDVL